jgi:Protein of unknown function (DUF1640)
MVMQVAALDVLTTKGRFAPEVARAIGEAVDMEIERSRESLATSRQLTDVQGQLTDMQKESEAEFAALRAEFKADFEVFRAAIKADIEVFRAEIKADFEVFRAEVKAEFAAVRAEFRAELKAEIAAVLTRVESTKADIARWLLIAFAGQTAALVGIIQFMLAHNR